MTYFGEINTLKIDLSNSSLLPINVLILSAEKSAIYTRLGKYAWIQYFSCKQLMTQLHACVYNWYHVRYHFMKNAREFKMVRVIAEIHLNLKRKYTENQNHPLYTKNCTMKHVYIFTLNKACLSCIVLWLKNVTKVYRRIPQNLLAISFWVKHRCEDKPTYSCTHNLHIQKYRTIHKLFVAIKVFLLLRS